MNSDMQKKINMISTKAREDALFMERLARVGGAGELKELCDEMGIAATPSEAQEGFLLLHKRIAESRTYNLSDEELERIAAGGETPQNANPAPQRDVKTL